jgi:hypothetical protein
MFVDIFIIWNIGISLQYILYLYPYIPYYVNIALIQYLSLAGCVFGLLGCKVLSAQKSPSLVYFVEYK